MIPRWLPCAGLSIGRVGAPPPFIREGGRERKKVPLPPPPPPPVYVRGARPFLSPYLCVSLSHAREEIWNFLPKQLTQRYLEREYG